MTDARTAPWLARHAADLVRFYYPRCVDDEYGGFVPQFDAETGEIYEREAKHLVATARFTTNFWRGTELFAHGWWGADGWTVPFDRTELRGQLRRGVELLRTAFRDETHGGYHWLLRGRTPAESRRVCYGHAFVLLAFARGVHAGIPGASDGLDDVATVLQTRFYEPDEELYRSGFDASWTTPEAYRGQNANMHACEALLAAYDATGTQAFLTRATGVARRLCVDLAATTDGRLWEHYTPEWTHDFAYNRDTPRDKFRPWGYQPGHHAEWAKLLALLHRRLDSPPPWVLSRAEELYEYSSTVGWDEEHGGFYYTLDRDDEPVVEEKYGWPVAEAIGAAAALFERTGNRDYLADYDRYWAYAAETLMAPAGNWYERVSRTGDPYPTSDGPAVEPGYHPLGACLESLRSVPVDR